MNPKCVFAKSLDTLKKVVSKPQVQRAISLKEINYNNVPSYEKLPRLLSYKILRFAPEKFCKS